MALEQSKRKSVGQWFYFSMGNEKCIVCLQKKVAAWNRCTRREDERDGQMMSHRQEVVIES